MNMNLKESRWNHWEWNVPVENLRGYIYLADSEHGPVLMTQYHYRKEDIIIDVEIIGIDNDFNTVTVSSATNFNWGMHVCESFESLAGAYLAYLKLRKGIAV